MYRQVSLYFTLARWYTYLNQIFTVFAPAWGNNTILQLILTIISNILLERLDHSIVAKNRTYNVFLKTYIEINNNVLPLTLSPPVTTEVLNCLLNSIRYHLQDL